MKRITSTDLANWAPTRDCQENLPLLIRKLIRASIVTVRQILIPAGDNVILPGYDGTVEVADGNEYIPSGSSLWEMGSGNDPEGKASDDFKKRTAAIDPSLAKKTTFVFVTPRVWVTKDKWVTEKRAVDKWHSVKVIDGQVLEEWIEQLPAVGAWLANHLHSPFADVQPIEEFWEVWSKSGRYNLSSELVVAGRSAEEKQLNDYFLNTPKLLSVKASTQEEAIAFIAASINRMNDDLKEEIQSKAVVVESERDFRHLVLYRSPMILIAKLDKGGLVHQATRNGHHVIIPVGNDVTATAADINLSRIRRQGFEQSLVTIGFTREVAEQLTRDCGQSLSVLRRLLKFDINQQPAWAKDGQHSDIIPVLLAGMWDDGNEEDKSALALFTGEPYERYTSRLVRWKTEKDAPVFQIKSIWRLTSALDAWSILAPFVSHSDLENFRRVFSFVLQEINPALQLDPDKRYLASLYGKTPKFSYSLKTGLAQTLILIAVFGERFHLNAVESPQGFADRLVSDLLVGATGDTWCTLHTVLPLLAEASPNSFLKAVEQSLNSDDKPILKMFGDYEGLFHSNSYYTGLLWALENLLIAPEYLLRTTLILGKLSRLDPGGHLANRPINTLRAAFIPWYGQTRADAATKSFVLKKLADEKPEVAWNLLLSVSPRHHSSVSPIHQCKWRFDTQQLEREVTNEEYWQFNKFLFSQLLKLATGDENKVAQLVDFYPDLGFENRESLLQFLRESKAKIVHKDNLIWNELRQLLSHHREHSEQGWALPADDLAKVDEVFQTYTPTDALDRLKYVFDEDWPHFPDGFRKRELPIEEREKLNQDKRTAAFQELYENGGIQTIIDLAKTLKNPFQLARTTVKMNLTPEEESVIIGLLGKDTNNPLNAFAHQYLFSKAVVSDFAWLKNMFAAITSIHSDAETLAGFFLSLPQQKETWDLLESLDKSVSEIYWRKLNPLLYQDRVEDKLYIVRNLQAVNRHVTVLDKIAHKADDVSSEILADVLLKAVTEKGEENQRIDGYDVGRIFELLESRNDLPEEQLSKLEWMYLPFLTSLSTNHSPKRLLRRLKSDTDFFVELVTYVYLPDEGHEREELSEEETTKKYRIANSARNLLEAWREVPGMQDDGSISKIELTSWVTAVREKAKNIHWLRGVDGEIGKLLACFPRNPNAWPPDEICEVIDALNSEVTVSYFGSEIFNSRGTYVKSPYEGGDQERALAAYFEKMGRRIEFRYPLTASALLKLAKGYEIDAKREDDDAHLDELR